MALCYNDPWTSHGALAEVTVGYRPSASIAGAGAHRLFGHLDGTLRSPLPNVPVHRAPGLNKAVPLNPVDLCTVPTSRGKRAFKIQMVTCLKYPRAAKNTISIGV